MTERHGSLTLPGRAHMYVETYSTGPEGRTSLSMACRGIFAMTADVVESDGAVRVFTLAVHGPAEQAKLLSALELIVQTMREAGVQPETEEIDPVPVGPCVWRSIRRDRDVPGTLIRTGPDTFQFRPTTSAPTSTNLAGNLTGEEAMARLRFLEPDCANPSYCTRERGSLDPCSTRGCLHSRSEG